MKGSTFTEAQIIAILREQGEAEPATGSRAMPNGAKTADRFPEKGHRVHRERDPGMGREDAGEVALHRPGQADARHGNCEAFNGRMRNELLNETLFVGIDRARETVARWTHISNTERPHSAPGYQAPAVFVAHCSVGATAPNSATDSGLNWMSSGAHCTSSISATTAGGWLQPLTSTRRRGVSRRWKPGSAR